MLRFHNKTADCTSANRKPSTAGRRPTDLAGNSSPKIAFSFSQLD